MTPDEFGSALAEFAPAGTKVVVTITSDCVVFSAIPRVYSKASLPKREFSVVPVMGQIDEVELDFALEALFPEAIALLKKRTTRSWLNLPR